jgi:type II secretory pathway pseudopilin PulG
MRFSKRAPGFTIIELMVSTFILFMISIAVSQDVTRTRFQEELTSSARVMVGGLRDLQARALAASSVSTCTAAASAIYVCEVRDPGCVGACGTQIPPLAYGMTISAGATSTSLFAEVDPTSAYNNRREHASLREDLGRSNFLTGVVGSNYVTIQNPITTDSGGFASITVTFERQSGRMRINACGDTPPPYTPGCVTPEPRTATIVLRHSRTNATLTIRLNALTGRISLE